MINLKPELSVLGLAETLVLRDGSGGKATPGGDNQGCTGNNMNCVLNEADE